MGYNVAVLPVAGHGSGPASYTACRRGSLLADERPLCARLLRNKLAPCEVVNGMDNSTVSPLLLQNSGIPPVDIVRDPRIGRLWTKYKETDLPVPKFKVSAHQKARCQLFPCGK